MQFSKYVWYFFYKIFFLSNSAAFPTWILHIYLPTHLEWGDKSKEGLMPLNFLFLKESGLSSLLPLPSVEGDV